jgi:hypothetical protein
MAAKRAAPGAAARKGVRTPSPFTATRAKVPGTKLRARLTEALAPAQQDETEQFRDVVAMLRDTAGAIEDFLKDATDAQVSVNVVPGHSVNAGLEHRIVVRSASHGISDYLLRAYVPLKGYPVVLDTVDEEDTLLRTREDLERSLVELMQKQWLRERLIGLREILDDPSMRTDGRVVGRTQNRRRAS